MLKQRGNGISDYLPSPSAQKSRRCWADLHRHVRPSPAYCGMLALLVTGVSPCATVSKVPIPLMGSPVFNT